MVAILLAKLGQTRPSASENQCKLYPPKRQLAKANQPSLDPERRSPRSNLTTFKRFLAYDFHLHLQTLIVCVTMFL